MITLTRTITNEWNPDNSTAVEWLEDGKHYHACYLTADSVTINLGQIYIPKTSTKVDPSDVSSLVLVGLDIEVDVQGGDEGFGDTLVFSEDCNQPQLGDYMIARNTDYRYETLVSVNFPDTKKYQICHLPSYSSGTNFILDQINNHWWIASLSPDISVNTPSTFNINDYPLAFDIVSSVTEGDEVEFFWKTEDDPDCDPTKSLSSTYPFQYGHFSLAWLGNDQGISGIDTTDKETIHMCWKSAAIGSDGSFTKVRLETNHIFEFIAQEYTNPAYTNLPELSSIYPSYGSTELYGTDAQLQFSFGGENVFPAKRSGVQGKLGIYRGAVTYDGEILPVLTSALYEITTLDEANIPLLSQGNIDCTALGV